MRLSVQDFERLCRQIFERHGFTKEEVDICTEEIVEAQCRGRISHGAAIIPEVLEWKKETPTGPIQIINETPVSAYMLANYNMGPVVARKAMDLAISKASASGIGIVGVNGKFPFILAGHNARRAAAKGLIGIVWSVAFSKVAPYGSIDPILGTNPLSIAVPSLGEPVVLDMAITNIPAAEIRRANRLGISIPEGVALTKEGFPTTNPKEALQGAMLPFDEYKGSDLGLMIELLGGAFVGAKVGRAVHGNRGMVFLAMKCDLFVSKAKFLGDVTSFIEDVRKSRTRSGFEEVLVPGQRADKLLAVTKRDGVDIDDEILKGLRTLVQ